MSYIPGEQKSSWELRILSMYNISIWTFLGQSVLTDGAGVGLWP